MLKKIITKDNSITYYNEEVQDYYHSQSGAEEEAKKKYAEPIKQDENKKDEIVIYDACFGLGYNAAAIIDTIRNKKLRIYCFENDKEILQKTLLLTPSFKSYSLIKEFIHNFLAKKQEELITPMVEIRMKYGDIQKKIKEKTEKADYVIYDPFSPSKQPELWTKEIFKEIHKKMNKKGKLLTYSCAKNVRKNLEETGFKVRNGPIIGRRSPSTIAEKD